MTTMKAAIIRGYGGPEAFEVTQMPMPRCGPKDVLVEVHAASVNPVDWKIRQGYQRAVVRRSMPAILGLDVSGVVVEVGDQVTGYAPGDAVFSSPTHARQGTYAEYIAIDADEIAHKPGNISHVEAASLPLVGQTAWCCLVHKARLTSGEKVFIEAGSGGVGTFAIQLARHLGAEVATTCSARNAELVRDLGADRVIDYTRERFEEVLDPQDVVLECMGGDAKARAARILKRGGRLTSINSNMVPRNKRYGPYLAVVVSAGALGWWMFSSRLFRGVRAWPVVRSPSGSDLAEIAALVEQGAIRAVIDQTFSLDDIAEAHRASQSGRTRGKIGIVVRP